MLPNSKRFQVWRQSSGVNNAQGIQITVNQPKLSGYNVINLGKVMKSRLTVKIKNWNIEPLKLRATFWRSYVRPRPLPATRHGTHLPLQAVAPPLEGRGVACVNFRFVAEYLSGKRDAYKKNTV